MVRPYRCAATCLPESFAGFCTVVEANSSAYRPITTASPRSGERLSRAIGSPFGSIWIFGGTQIVTFHVGAVRSASRRSSCGGTRVELNAGSRSSLMLQKAAERVLLKPHLPSQVRILLLAGPGVREDLALDLLGGGRSFRLPTPRPATDPENQASKGGDTVGLMLLPGGGDVTSPDVSWSYTGFHMFRQWLADTEGFTLTEMRGFGGDRAWSSVSTPLTPLLDHVDDDGFLTTAQCAAMLPRLEAIIDQLRPEDSDLVLLRRVDDTRQLVTVMQYCLDTGVELHFG
ncbi:hypothetical protein ACK8N7_01580 [Streptomyces griseobrunneus]